MNNETKSNCCRLAQGRIRVFQQVRRYFVSLAIPQRLVSIVLLISFLNSPALGTDPLNNVITLKAPPLVISLVSGFLFAFSVLATFLAIN